MHLGLANPDRQKIFGGMPVPGGATTTREANRDEASRHATGQARASRAGRRRSACREGKPHFRRMAADTTGKTAVATADSAKQSEEP